MKKISALMSAVLAGLLAVHYSVIATAAQPQRTVEEFIEIYRDSEDDYDFNLDGDVDTIDAKFVLVWYSELVTGKNSDVVIINGNESDVVSQGERLVFNFTDEMRAKVDEYGDADINGYINATDAAYLLTAFFSDKEKGDVNTDGKLDARDASDMLKYYSNNSVSIQSDYVTEKNMEYLGDLNWDGKVDSSDASFALVEYSKRATE